MEWSVFAIYVSQMSKDIVVIPVWSFPHSWLITGFVTRMPHVEQELSFYVMFGRSLFVPLSLFFWQLSCISFVELWMKAFLDTVIDYIIIKENFSSGSCCLISCWYGLCISVEVVCTYQDVLLFGGIFQWIHQPNWEIHSSTSLDIPGQYKRSFNNDNVLSLPGWPMSLCIASRIVLTWADGNTICCYTLSLLVTMQWRWESWRLKIGSSFSGFCPVSTIILQYSNLESFSCAFFQSMISEVDVPAVASSISSLTKSGDIARHSTYGMEVTELQMVRIYS